MVNILVCNQKGGVGKSLIADELAFYFERAKIPLSFIDLDAQGGTLHQTVQREDAKVAVIDTPGALQPELKNWIASADVVVIPTKTTSRDIEPLQRMQRLVYSTGKQTRVVYVLNGWNRWRASNDFMDWMKGSVEGAMILMLPQSEQFVQAGACGVSVVEYAKNSAAAMATIALCNAVTIMAGLSTHSRNCEGDRTNSL